MTDTPWAFGENGNGGETSTVVCTQSDDADRRSWLPEMLSVDVAPRAFGRALSSFRRVSGRRLMAIGRAACLTS